MPKTRSAAKQARSSVRKQSHNKTVKSRLHTLERNFEAFVSEKKAVEAAAAYRVLAGALAKAAKVQIIHPNTASRKKSRLAAHLKKIAAAA